MGGAGDGRRPAPKGIGMTVNESGRPLSIGIFDSGIGGLTVLKAVRKRLPAERFVYFGDTARVPYGTKSGGTVVRYSLQIIRFLLREGVKMIIVACNTSSALALPEIRSAVEVPVLDVLGPGAARAVAESRSGRIGVVGTEATIRSDSYARAMKGKNAAVEVVSRPCPLFVPLVEEGWVRDDDPITLAIAERYLLPFKGAGIDTLVLGCTHYPLLKPVIRKVLGDEIVLIDSAEVVAESAAALRGDGAVPVEDSGSSRLTCYVTDSAEKFRELAPRFLESRIDDIRHVDI
jgi:glutamate racemase